MFKRSWDDFSIFMFNYGGLRKNGQSFILHLNKGQLDKNKQIFIQAAFHKRGEFPKMNLLSWLFFLKS